VCACLRACGRACPRECLKSTAVTSCLELFASSCVAEARELDDHEFEVYVVLRAWRLKKSRALDKEPYKVFQNRTFCEAIRRRRNDVTWGSAATRDERAAQLLECWGIGAKKTEEPDGYAWELLDILDQSSSVNALDLSRALTVA
jgi:hypothetical protein